MLYSSFMGSGEKGGASILSVNIHQKRKHFEKNVPLYDALKAGLGQSLPWAHRAHWTTCLWRLVALIQRGEVSLRVFHTFGKSSHFNADGIKPIVIGMIGENFHANGFACGFVFD